MALNITDKFLKRNDKYLELFVVIEGTKYMIPSRQKGLGFGFDLITITDFKTSRKVMTLASGETVTFNHSVKDAGLREIYNEYRKLLDRELEIEDSIFKEVRV